MTIRVQKSEYSFRSGKDSEGGEGPRGDGPEPDSGIVIGVDVGGTTTHVAVVDEHLDIVCDVVAPTLIGGPDQVSTWNGS